MSGTRKPIDLRRTLHHVHRTGAGNLHDNGVNYAPEFKGQVRGAVLLRHPDKFVFKHAHLEEQWMNFTKTLHDDLGSLTVGELNDLAASRGVEVPAGTRKADLVSLLNGK